MSTINSDDVASWAAEHGKWFCSYDVSRHFKCTTRAAVDAVSYLKRGRRYTVETKKGKTPNGRDCSMVRVIGYIEREAPLGYLSGNCGLIWKN